MNSFRIRLTLWWCLVLDNFAIRLDDFAKQRALEPFKILLQCVPKRPLVGDKTRLTGWPAAGNVFDVLPRCRNLSIRPGFVYRSKPMRQALVRALKPLEALRTLVHNDWEKVCLGTIFSSHNILQRGHAVVYVCGFPVQVIQMPEGGTRFESPAVQTGKDC